MEKSQRYIGTPGGVVLCIDDTREGQPCGRFYHAYSRTAGEFLSMEELLFKLEQFYDSIKFPYPATNCRTFQKREQGLDLKEERIRVMSDEELLCRHGDMGSFIIRVQHRQNSSWQGRITWVEENKTVCFRSMWEMLKLIENALEAAGGAEASWEVSWTDD